MAFGLARLPPGQSRRARGVVIEIESRPSVNWDALRAVWNARRVLIYMISRDLRGRYRGSLLGNWWIILRPLIELLPYMIVFSVFLGLRPGPMPYLIYLLSGFAPWLLIRSSVGAAPSVITKNRSLIKKVYFPRLIVPLAALGTNLLDFGVMLGAVMLLSLPFGLVPLAHIWALPFFTLLLIALAFGIALVVSVACTQRPDLSFGVGPVLRIVLYMSPVVYPINIIPPSMRDAYLLNPITTVISGIRWSLFGIDAPSAKGVAVAVFFAAALLIAGLYVFLREERRFADVL